MSSCRSRSAARPAMRRWRATGVGWSTRTRQGCPAATRTSSSRVRSWCSRHSELLPLLVGRSATYGETWAKSVRSERTPAKECDMAATATARWEGTIDDGSGTMSTATGLEGSFTKASRFADGKGTNPEELLGAAHAGCFSQYLALLLTTNEPPPTCIQTPAQVSIRVGDDGPPLNRIALSTVVDVDLPAETGRSHV